MRILATGLLLGLVALPAQAQSDYDLCFSETATDDQTISSCTALINSGRYSGTELSHIYNNRAFGYDGKKEWDLAIRDDTAAIGFDPSNAQAFNNRCLAYLSKGLYEKAIADCTQAIALKPNYREAYQNRAAAYENSGERNLAISDYRTAHRLDPSNNWVTDRLKRLGVTP